MKDAFACENGPTHYSVFYLKQCGSSVSKPLGCGGQAMSRRTPSRGAGGGENEPL